MQYVEFTQRQDAETLLNCMVHALTYFGGVPATLLTDNMKTVVLDRVDGQPRFHARMLDFASYYGFVPRVCHPYRPQTKGKIESTIRYIKGSFWPGLSFDSLQELNRQALAWCGEANQRVHATTREIPQVRFAHEGLTALNGQPAYDTSYVSHRQVAKDCLVAYRGNRYSVPHVHAGRDVIVREPLDSGALRIFLQQELRSPMSLQSERLLNHMLRLCLSHLPNCYEAIAEAASTKNLPYLDFLEQALEAESQAKHSRNVRLKTQWAHFPYNKGLDQFDFAFQPSIDERKLHSTTINIKGESYRLKDKKKTGVIAAKLPGNGA
jgi:hypothetical protein